MVASPVGSCSGSFPSRYQRPAKSRAKRSDYLGPARGCGVGRRFRLRRRRPATAALGGAAVEGRVDLVLAVAESDVGGGGEAPQEGKRAAVVAEHRGPKRDQSAPPADTRQLVQQPSSKTAVLPLVVHDHRDLGVVLARAAVVTGDGDDL